MQASSREDSCVGGLNVGCDVSTVRPHHPQVGSQCRHRRAISSAPVVPLFKSRPCAGHAVRWCRSGRSVGGVGHCVCRLARSVGSAGRLGRSVGRSVGSVGRVVRSAGPSDTPASPSNRFVGRVGRIGRLVGSVSGSVLSVGRTVGGSDRSVGRLRPRSVGSFLVGGMPMAI